MDALYRWVRSHMPIVYMTPRFQPEILKIKTSICCPWMKHSLLLITYIPCRLDVNPKTQNEKNQNPPSPAACPLHPPRLASVNPTQSLRWNHLTVDPQTCLVIPLINITRSKKKWFHISNNLPAILKYFLIDLKSIQADRLIETDRCSWEGLAGNRLQQRQESTWMPEHGQI